MLSSFDMQCLSRLEDRWLDPDYNAIPEDTEDDKWKIADMEGEEEWVQNHRN